MLRQYNSMVSTCFSHIQLCGTTPTINSKASCRQQTAGDTGGKPLGMPWVPVGAAVASAAPSATNGWGANQDSSGLRWSTGLVATEFERHTIHLPWIIKDLRWPWIRMDVSRVPPSALTYAVKKAAVAQLFAIWNSMSWLYKYRVWGLSLPLEIVPNQL